MAKTQTAIAQALIAAGIDTKAAKAAPAKAAKGKAPAKPEKAAKAPAPAKPEKAPAFKAPSKAHIEALIATMEAAVGQVTSATHMYYGAIYAAGRMAAFKGITEAFYTSHVAPVMKDAAARAFPNGQASRYASLSKSLFMAAAHGIALGAAVSNFDKEAARLRKALIAKGAIEAVTQGRKPSAPGSKAPANAKAPAPAPTAGAQAMPGKAQDAAIAAANAAKAGQVKVFNRVETEAALALALGKRAEYAPLLIDVILNEPAKLAAWLDALTA